MTPEFWHERWRQGEIGWHASSVNLHLQDHWPRLGVAPGTQVFVPLCGKTLDLLWLAAQGLRVLGVEISRVAVDAFFADNALRPEITEAPPFLRYRAAEIEILCGDFFDLGADRLEGIGAVFDRASLIALPPDMRPRYAAHLARLLRPPIAMLLITLDYAQDEMAGPPFAVGEAEVRALYGAGFHIEPIARVDVLAENERFRQRGLTHLDEQVYRLASR